MKLGKVYEPDKFESDIYELWEKSGAFVPKNRGNDDVFSMVMPPPNANANIHLGTAITLDLEDIAVRYNRMLGKSTLFVPGADHAGFETQAVYEKHLAKEGKSRFDFSREDLYKQVWDFVAGNKTNYETQFRKLGASPDWSRYVYTLDKKIVTRAYSTFKKMWDEGLIYRGERLVNFCTFHGTGFADIEVTFKNEKSHLWHIQYPLTDGSGGVVVATTRPETMFGDTAVAVHPDDKRYKKFIGKTIKLPLTNREIPILADTMVETEFGTGAVKITPAHDQNDYDVAGRHDLPMITVVDFEGKMNHHAPENMHNMVVNEAREATVKELKEKGFLVKTEDYEHSVGHCYKCGTVIQPLLREQWFVDMQPLAKKAIKALEGKQVTFYPDSKRIQLISYLKGLKDWNISRQIAWGIPIPAFQSVDKPGDWIFDDNVSEETITVAGKTYTRDPDVFDTWFSSSSWPYATLDFPDGEDFKKYYPLSVLETGGEILYPWVSRMLMLGLYITGQVPFKAVYIHGYVMAEDGTKMSKSLGNVIDPLPLIAEHGSDALRMGLIAGRAPAINRSYDASKIEGARNFCNKLWNIARFIEDIVGDDAKQRIGAQPGSIADEWMLSKLQQTTEKITADLANYRFAEGYDSLYHLVWDDLADWYLEASKSAPNKPFLAYVLETILKLAHPYAPFLTETIWQTLAWENDSILAVASWPKVTGDNDKQAKTFQDIQAIVTEIRRINTSLKKPVKSAIATADNPLAFSIDLIDRLARVTTRVEAKNPKGLKIEQGELSIWLDMDQASINDMVDSLTEKTEGLKREVTNLEKRLSNKSYVENAPEKLVNETKQQLEQKRAQLNAAKIDIKHFKN